jgi:RimJ/RimL family protein N-acetyltransferase
MAVILETVRLYMRHFTVADAPFMLRLVNEPSWIQFIGDRKVYTLEDAENYLLNGSIKSYQEHGFGFFPVFLKGTETPIGTCGFAQRPFLDYPDFGFAFLPEYTGQGYATEIAVATLAYAEEVLKLETVYAYATKDNIRSIRLLSKTGFTFEKYIQLEEELLLFKAALHFVHKDEDEDAADQA